MQSKSALHPAVTYWKHYWLWQSSELAFFHKFEFVVKILNWKVFRSLHIWHFQDMLSSSSLEVWKLLYQLIEVCVVLHSAKILPKLHY